MASSQEAKLNLVITAKDEARTVINDFVRSVEESVKSLQSTLDSLNKFKFKNPISASTVDAIKRNVGEINAAFASIGQNGGGAGASESVGASVQKDAAKVKSSVGDITSSLQAIRTNVSQTNETLNHTSPGPNPYTALLDNNQLVQSSLKSLGSVFTTESSSIDNNIRGWGKAYATVVHEMEQDANGVYQVVDKLKSSMGSVKSTVDSVKTAASEAGGALATLGERGVIPFQKMDDGLKKIPSHIDEIGTAADKVKPKLDSLRKGFDFMQLQFAGQQIQQYGRTITDFVVGTIKSAADFNQSVMNIAGSLRAQGESAQTVQSQLKSLNDTAIEMGSNGYFSANQVADAMNVMTRQGITYQEMMSGALKTSHDVAAANQADLSDTVNVISDIVRELGGPLIKQYGTMGNAMSHVGDAMTDALHHARMSMTDFLGTMKYAGPQAGQLGIQFSDLSATIADLAQHGIRGYQAGTTLRRMFTNLTPASAAAAQEMSTLGLITKNGSNIFYDATGHLKSLADVQSILHSHLASLTPQMEQFAIKTIFGQYALSGMTAITNDAPSKFKELTKTMAQTGSTQAILEEKSKGVGFQIQHMQAEWQTLVKLMGELFLPIAVKVIGILDNIMTGIRKFIEAHTGLARILGVMTAVVGVVMLLGGTLAVFLGTLGMLKTAIVDLIPALSGVDIALGPVALAIGAVIVAGIGIYELITHWTQVTAWIKKNFGIDIPKTLHQLSQVFTQIWKNIQTVVSTVWNYVGPTIINGIKEVSAYWKQIWPEVKQVFQEVWSILKPIIGVAFGVWKAEFNAFFSVIKAVWKPFWNTIGAVFKAFWDVTKGLVKTEWDIVSGIFKVALDLLTGKWGKAWGDLKSTFKNVWNDLKGMFSNLLNDALDFGKNFVQMIANGVMASITSVEKAVSGVASKIKGFLGFHSPTEQGPASDSDQWMPNMMKMFNTGITKELPQLKASLGGVATTIKQTVVPASVATSVNNFNTTYGYAPATRASGGVTIQNLTVTAPRGTNARDFANALAKEIRTQMAVVSA